MANEKKVNTIVIPMLGCGVLQTPVNKCAIAMSKGFSKSQWEGQNLFSPDYPESERILQEVFIPSYDEGTYKKFVSVWEEPKAPKIKKSDGKNELQDRINEIIENNIDNNIDNESDEKEKKPKKDKRRKKHEEASKAE